MVTAAAGPRAGVRLGQLEIRRARRGWRLTVVAVAEVVPVARIVVIVIAQLEEPHEPDDQGANVKDAQPDHEDPPLQRHCRAG